MLEILAAGPLSLVQDLGRPAWRALGIPAGGAMDAPALQRANALLGNAPGAAAIELVAGPLRLRCHRDAWFALAGADFEAFIDGRPQPPGLRWQLPAGAQLELRGPRVGQYALLAVDGGIDVPLCLGSRSTAVRAGFGGHEGRALRRGDRLPLGPANAALQGRRGLRGPAFTALLGLLPGPEYEELDAASRAQLWAARWRLTPQSDRMGLRLAGPALQRSGPELLSHAVAPGLLQLPPSGQPILLGADAQTTGGYPRLGQLAAAELWKLAQLRPGDTLQFAPLDLDSARRLLVEQQRELVLLRRNLECAST